MKLNAEVASKGTLGLGIVDCGKAIAKLVAAAARLSGRTADSIIHGSCPDKGHQKAISEAKNQVNEALERVKEHCSGTAEGAAAIAAGEAALAAAARLLAALFEALKCCPRIPIPL